MLAHVPSFGRNPRGSPDFLAYPVPKACMHVLGTRVPRRLGVARSASSPEAALALGCSLTPGLRILFGRVTCMARAASVPGLWALGFLLLACVCGWVRVAVGRGFCLPLPVVAGVLGGCVRARFVVLCLFCRLFVVFVVGLWCRPAFGTCVVSCPFPLPPAVSGSGVRCGRACWARVSAVPRPSWLGCRVCFLRSFFSGCWLSLSGPCGLFPRPLSFGLGCWLFFFFFCVCLFRWPFSRWAAVPGLVLPLLAGWFPCACLGVLFSVPSGWGVWPPSVLLAGGLVAVGCFRATPPPSFFGGGGGGGGLAVPPLAFPRLALAGVWCGWSLATPGGGSRVLLPATPGLVSLPLVVGGPRHSWLGSAGGGGVWCVVCGGGVLVGLWLVCGVVGPSPILAEVRVCYSPPLLAGFRCRWWWVVPATPGWGPLAALLCGVWCVAVVCWWGCGWCVVWLVPRHSWRRFLCATPRHSWLGFAAGGGGRSPPLLAGVGWRRCCVVCGVWRWCVGGVVAGVWCGWSLATPGGGSRVLLPATPGWVSLPVVVGGPRHSWLGSACGGVVWCVVCGVWCVAVVCWWGCGWCVVWLVPRHSWRRFLCATPRHSWLGFAAAGGGRSPPLLAGVRWRRWCVVCGVCCVAVVCCWGCGWCVVWLVPCHSWRRSLCATPRHSWLGFAAGGGGRSLPLLAGVRWRRWCVVCGVLVGSLATPGGGPCVLLPATPGWVSLPLVVGGPRHSWLGSAGGGGVWCVVCGGGVLVGLWLVCGVVGPSPLLAEVPMCYSPPLLAGFRCRWWWAVPATPGWGPLAALLCGVWCVAVVCWWGCGWCVVWLVPRHSWRRFSCATPRHSWLGFAAAGGGRSPPLLAVVRLRRCCVVCGVWCVVCGGGVLVGLWLVCGVVGPSPLLSEVPVCYSPPLLAGFRCRWWWAVPATPGWGPLAAVVCGVWCVVCGGGVLLGLWLVCGVVGPSPLLAEVPVCYSPPLLVGSR